MRLLRTIMIFATLLTMSGCYSEDYSMCPPIRGKASLHFTLPDKLGNDIFAGKVSSVDVMVYDASGAYVMKQHIDQAALNEFRGTHLLLSPGQYSVVCWGNVKANSQLVGVEDQATPTINYSQINAGKVGSTDKVFYAEKINDMTRASDTPQALRITIPNEGVYEGNAIFRYAHRDFEIYIEGYKEGTAAAFPIVEFSNLPAGLNMLNMGFLESLGTVKGHYPTQNAVVGGTIYAGTVFQTFWFNLDNPITINIYSPVTGELVYSIPLADAIEPTTDPEVILIRIIFEFKSTGVEITMPDWGSNDVDWGFDYQ